MGNAVQKASTVQRHFYLDFLRVCACFFVVMLHISGNYATAPTDTVNFWLGNLVTSPVEVCVPVFVMISGALMLDEGYHFSRKKLIGHVKKLGCFYFFWSTLYALPRCVIGPISRGEGVNLRGLCWAVLRGHYHLWFIPMIIGLYLMIPLLRLWVKRSNRVFVEYYLVLSMIFAFAIPQGIKFLAGLNPMFESFSYIESMINMKYFMGFTPYFVLGWYLHNFELRKPKCIAALGIAALLVTIAGTYIDGTLFHEEGNIFYDNFAVNVLFCAIAFFALTKMHFEQRKCIAPWFERLIRFLSQTTMGVYAIHATLLTRIYAYFDGTNAAVEIPVIFILCAGMSVAITAVLRKIPILRRLV